MARRALRLDKCNVVPVFCEGGDVRSLIVIRQGRAHLVSTGSGDVRPTLALDQCRNVLHQSICRSGSGHFFFGKYGANPSRVSVPIYRSIDGGESWQEAYSISGGKARHVHGCFWDPYERRVWVSTGDFERENHLLCADEDFEDIEWLGDGSQVWRTCRLLFGPDAVYWMMDSHLEDSYSVRLDRRTRQVTKLQCLPGPVWYAKALSDGFFVAATTYEMGPGVHDTYAHVLVSRDCEHWEDVYQFRHDGLPRRYFKSGVIGFADGEQSSQAFYIFGEALKGIDGKAALCCLEE